MRLQITLVILLIASTALAGETRNDFCILYGDLSVKEESLVWQQYDMSVEGRANDADTIRKYNPNFKMFYYISLSDMFPVERPEYKRNFLDSCANEAAISVEEMNFHYWDTTRHVGGDPLDTTLCQGMENADSSWFTAQDTLDCRCRNAYYNQNYRFLTNLYSANVRTWNVLYVKNQINIKINDTTLDTADTYWSGIFWDNGSRKYGGTPIASILEGGHVAEHPTKERIDSIFASTTDWWWDACVAPFYNELMDTLANGANWATDGLVKESMPNMLAPIGLGWDETIPPDSVLDFWYGEYWPAWYEREGFLQNAYEIDSTLNEHGQALLHSPVSLNYLAWNESDSTATSATDEGDWADPDSVFVSDDDRAKHSGTNQDILRAYGFDYSVMASQCSIMGITVTIEGYGVGGDSATRAVDVALAKNGYTPEGDWKTNDLASSEGNLVFGSASDQWGGEWSATEIKDPNFSLLIRDNNVGNDSIYIDNIKCRITYREYRTHQQALYSQLCWFYLTTSPTAWLFNQRVNGPSSDTAYSGWDTLVWCGAMAQDVGDAVDAKYAKVDSGTDDRGYDYYIYKRDYDSVTVYLRARGVYNEHIGDSTYVTLSLDSTYRELLPDGTWETAKDSLLFRNGEGRIIEAAAQAAVATRTRIKGMKP